MPEIKFALVCWHEDCAGQPPTEIILKVPAKSGGASARQKEKVVYCAHNHPNVITIPAAWDMRPLTLGVDGVVAMRDGVPVIQGKRG